MSWHYLQGEVEVSSEAISWDGQQFAPSKSKTILGEFYSSDNETESSRTSRYGTIFERLMDDLGAGDVILLPAGSRVRTFQSQEKARGLKGNGRACGVKCAGSLNSDEVDFDFKTKEVTAKVPLKKGDIITKGSIK